MTGLNGLTAFQNLYRFRRAPTVFMESLRREHGDLVTLRLGHRRFYFAYHPDAAQRVLRDNFGNYPKSRLIFRMIRPITGMDGLVQLSGERWSELRKQTNGLFLGDNLERYLPKIDDVTTDVFSQWDQRPSPELPFDVAPWITDMVLRASGKILFSADFAESAMELGEKFVEMNRICGERIRSVVYAPQVVPTKRNRYLARQRKALDLLSRRLILEHQDTSSDLISLLRSSGDETFLVNQMLTFLFAGHEATATSVLWAVYLLAKHPKAQDRARAEVGSTVKISPAIVSSWKYLSAVYKEGMRLYPPAWILAREVAERDVMCGEPIQRGATLLLSIREIHRHPQFWDSPSEFQPERFLPDEGSSRHPFAYLPFGGGPRICSGYRLAPLEACTILARILQRYRLHAVPGAVAVEEMITARPKGGLPIRLESLH